MYWSKYNMLNSIWHINGPKLFWKGEKTSWTRDNFSRMTSNVFEKINILTNWRENLIEENTSIFEDTNAIASQHDPPASWTPPGFARLPSLMRIWTGKFSPRYGPNSNVPKETAYVNTKMGGFVSTPTIAQEPKKQKYTTTMMQVIIIIKWIAKFWISTYFGYWNTWHSS